MLISSTVSVGLGRATHNSMYLPGATAQPTIPDFNFAAAGDWGCNSNTVATVNSIVNQGSDFTLGLGDYSYQSSANCFISRVNPIDENMAIAIGNHENSGSEDLNTYLSHFGGLTSQYYSFNVQNVHFLVMATEISYSSGSAQHTFVKNDLAAASSNPDIDWIVVFFHKPMYSSSNSCSSSGCSGLSSLRDTYHALFDQNDVDLVLEGHVHDYQRSAPIKFNANSKSNPIVTNNNLNTYNDPEGEIHVIVGTGGVNFHELEGQKSFIKSQQDDKFGHLNVALTNNGKILTGKFIANDNTVMDQFTITKTLLPTEICGNGIDDDLDGQIDENCTEKCGNGIDDDLDGQIDENCTEICGNGIDDDLDGQIDEGCPPSGTGYHYSPFFTATGSNFIDQPSSTALKLTKFSVAAWFKTSSTFPDDGFIVNKGGSGSDSSGQNQNYGLWFNSGEKASGGYETTGGSNKFVTSPTTFNDNQWHHGVVTFDGSIVKLYIDGLLQVPTLASTSTPDNTGNQPLRIGANSRASSDFFVGQIDEVGVWDRALLKEEIDNLRNFGVFPSDWKYRNTFGISPTSIETPSQEIQDELPLNPSETAKGIGMEEKLQENSQETQILSLRDLMLPPIQSFIPDQEN
ncbi:MAG: LamG-like jellyroll fold domain-containing protein [Nitrososphaeraceae archaeon]